MGAPTCSPCCQHSWDVRRLEGVKRFERLLIFACSADLWGRMYIIFLFIFRIYDFPGLIFCVPQNAASLFVAARNASASTTVSWSGFRIVRTS